MNTINPDIFKNTKVAFAAKSNKQLKKARFLFRSMGNSSLSAMGTFFTKIGLKWGLPITGLVKSTIFEQFCGGESIGESEQTMNLLGAHGIGTILDYSVEGEALESAFEATKNEILETIRKSKDEEHIPFSVFKLTGVGRFAIYEKVQAGLELTDEEQKEFSNAKARVEELCAFAHENDNPLLIDAEETWIQDTIDAIVLEMMGKYNKQRAIVYNTIQFYRVEGMNLLRKQHQKALDAEFHYGVKMVRGAYMEQERARAKEKGYVDPIHANKKATDQCYNEGIEYCATYTNRISLCAGTHNEESAILLMQHMAKLNIAKNDPRIYFAQLLGMSDHISFNLSSNGYNVAKYVPYGPVASVMPYLIRRAEENTSVSGQAGRELSLIEEEIQRRTQTRS